MWAPLLIVVAALLRSIFGWIENSCEDGKITLPEWKKLAATIFRMSIPIVGLIYGFVNGFIVGWIFACLYNCFVKSPEE